MSSLAALISNVKANTANDAKLQKSLAVKRKNTSNMSEESAKKRKKETETKQTTSGPQVVVFDESTLKSQPAVVDRLDKKAFMSSKVIRAPPISAAPPPKPVSKGEKEDEEENDRKDVELKELLATTKLLEEYQKEEMTGKERRRHMWDKLEQLGAKTNKKQKRPIAVALGMDAKRKVREQKRLQEAKDTGMYDKSLRHLYITPTKKKERDRDPGITAGVGRMKGATLYLRKSDIQQEDNQRSKKAPHTKGSKRR